MFNRTKHSNMCIEPLYFVKCIWPPPPNLQNEKEWQYFCSYNNVQKQKKIQASNS